MTNLKVSLSFIIGLEQKKNMVFVFSYHTSLGIPFLVFLWYIDATSITYFIIWLSSPNVIFPSCWDITQWLLTSQWFNLWSGWELPNFHNPAFSQHLLTSVMFPADLVLWLCRSRTWTNHSAVYFHLSTQVFFYGGREEKRRVSRYVWDIPQAIKGNTFVTLSCPLQAT